MSSHGHDDHAQHDDLLVLGQVMEVLKDGTRHRDFDEALATLKACAGADACELFLIDGTGGELLLTSFQGQDADAFLTRERFELGSGFPGLVARDETPIATRDLVDDPRYLRREVTSRGWQSYVCVPVIRRGKVLGTLHLAWKDRWAPIERGLRLLQLASDPLATALVAGHHEIREALIEACADVLEDDLPSLAEAFRLAGEGSAATVALFDPEDPHMHDCGSSHAHSVLCTNVPDGGLPRCVGGLPRGRCVVLSGRRGSWPVPCRSMPGQFATVLGVPISHRGGTWGAAFVGYDRVPDGPSTRHMGRLIALAERVAPLLRRGRAHPTVPSGPTEEGALPGRQRLKLQCFGPFIVLVDGRPVPYRTFQRNKAVELLKRLALAGGRPIHRGDLIEALWPDANPDAGIGRLNVTLHALRKAIEPPGCGRDWVHVLSQGEMLQLNPDTCATDLFAFDRLVALSHCAEVQLSPTRDLIDLLQRAVALYRGDLFADEPDALWCAAEREAWQQRWLSVLTRLSRLVEHQGSAEWSRALLRRGIAAAPLRAELHRALIQALWNAGEHLEAQHQYDASVETLHSLLGVDRQAAAQRLRGALRG